MENRYHLLIEKPETTISCGMRRLNGRYTQEFHWWYRLVGHVLSGRFKSLVIVPESYLLELCRYLVRNLVRAGLVVMPQGKQRLSLGLATRQRQMMAQCKAMQ